MTYFFGSSDVTRVVKVVARREWRGWALAVLTLMGASAVPATVTAQKLQIPLADAPGPDEGKRPTGWIVRADTNKQAGHFPDSVKLVHHGKGYYLGSGPSAIVWTPSNVLNGNFILAGVMTSGPTGAAIPDGFGVFLGGKNLQTPQAQYTEFLVRNDGRYAVFQHVGSKVVTLKDWTVIAGINLHSGRRDETVRNTFRVIVDAKTVQVVVNRALAASFPRAQFMPDGTYGMRIGTKQSIQLETLGPEKPAPATAPTKPTPRTPKPPQHRSGLPMGVEPG